MNMSSPIVKAGIGALLIWGATKYVNNAVYKGVVASVGAMILAKQTPVIKDLIA